MNIKQRIQQRLQAFFDKPTKCWTTTWLAWMIGACLIVILQADDAGVFLMLLAPLLLGTSFFSKSALKASWVGICLLWPLTFKVLMFIDPAAEISLMDYLAFFGIPLLALIAVSACQYKQVQEGLLIVGSGAISGIGAILGGFFAFLAADSGSSEEEEEKETNLIDWDAAFPTEDQIKNDHDFQYIWNSKN